MDNSRFPYSPNVFFSTPIVWKLHNFCTAPVEEIFPPGYPQGNFPLSTDTVEKIMENGKWKIENECAAARRLKFNHAGGIQWKM